MRIKSYFSHSVEAAITEARRELGSDAVLVSTRSASPETQHLGRYEVVFGSFEPSASTNDPRITQAPLVASSASVATPSGPQVIAELSELRRHIEELCQTVYHHAAPGNVRNENVERYIPLLVESGIPMAQAVTVAESVAERASSAESGQSFNEATLRRLVASELESRIRVTGGLGASASRAVIALIGPSGAGKTEMLVKLAVSEGIAMNRPVRLITTDCERVGASARLQSFATILGLTLQVCDAAALLDAALRRKQDRELVLIDTPGYSPADMACSRELGALFNLNKEIRPTLVLSATMKLDDMEDCLRRFSFHGPTELIFTHLDETRSFGAIWSLAAACRLPISFFGTGQQIPEDLEPATLGKISFLLLNGRTKAASHAA